MNSTSYQKIKRFWNVVAWISIVLVILCMIGFVVCIILLARGSVQMVLLGALMGGMVLGAILLGGVGFFSFKRSEKALGLELDSLECEDSPHSFYVGEGTLATFQDAALRIHGGREKKVEFTVPYSEMRFFSVCARRAPKEEGEWSVVIEIPARYFNRGAKKNDPPVLIQTDGKDRLYQRLEELNLTLIGEKRGAVEAKEFTKQREFSLAHPKKRKQALLLCGAGGILFAGGIGAMFWNTTVGAFCIVIGFYIGLRALMAYFRAKAEFAVYQEGIYYRDLSGNDRVFLKWEEFSKIFLFQKDGIESMRIECPYGAYEFPRFPGLYEYLCEKYPMKCEREESKCGKS